MNKRPVVGALLLLSSLAPPLPVAAGALRVEQYEAHRARGPAGQASP